MATFGQIGGEMLKRVPQGFPTDHPEAELLKHKDLTFGHRLSDDDVTSPGLPDVIADSFEVAVPVMRWLARCRQRVATEAQPKARGTRRYNRRATTDPTAACPGAAAPPEDSTR